jgi:hypothetical protein
MHFKERKHMTKGYSDAIEFPELSGEGENHVYH